MLATTKLCNSYKGVKEDNCFNRQLVIPFKDFMLSWSLLVHTVTCVVPRFTMSGREVLRFLPCNIKHALAG